MFKKSEKNSSKNNDAHKKVFDDLTQANGGGFNVSVGNQATISKNSCVIVEVTPFSVPDEFKAQFEEYMKKKGSATPSKLSLFKGADVSEDAHVVVNGQRFGK